jgi:hypothetical protein
VLDECQKVQRRLDRQVQRWQEQTKIVERQATRVAAGKKPLGVNPKTDVQAHAAKVRQAEYVTSSLSEKSSFDSSIGINPVFLIILQSSKAYRGRPVSVSPYPLHRPLP